MHVNYLSEAISTSPQIDPRDMSAIREAGFRSIICNRPDGEEFGQPSFEQIDAAAKAAGLQARYVPFAPGMALDAATGDFAAAMRELPGPVLAYCRSGARSAALWSQCQASATS